MLAPKMYAIYHVVGQDDHLVIDSWLVSVYIMDRVGARPLWFNYRASAYRGYLGNDIRELYCLTLV